MTTQEMERAVVLLPRDVVEALDRAATEQGMSRSGLVRTLVMRYLRERGKE